MSDVPGWSPRGGKFVPFCVVCRAVPATINAVRCFRCRFRCVRCGGAAHGRRLCRVCDSL